MLDSKKLYFLITYFRKRTLAEVCELQLIDLTYSDQAELWCFRR